MAEVRAPGRSTQGSVASTMLATGKRLGRYELLAPIGVGGMAAVWAARVIGEAGLSKVVAIKSILPHLSGESGFERLFLDEARIAALVRHPNVCEIYELCEHGELLFLVMEWVDGDSLFRLLKGSGRVAPIPTRVAALIGAGTCAGLHAAHVQRDTNGKPLNIVHRDVSPHNVLLSAGGIVKVTDFGVAKAVGQTHDETIAGQLKGKLEYMSPEQVTGSRVDRRTDVFGIGGVIYEATTGKQAFQANADLETMSKIVEGRITRPSEHVRGYPPELEAILLKAMASRQDDRFSSADEMRQALESWLARSGPPMSHEDVAALLRARVGVKMDERLARIHAAMTLAPPRGRVLTPSTSGISSSRIIPTQSAPRQQLLSRPAPSRPALAPPTPRADLPDLFAPDSGASLDGGEDADFPEFLGRVPTLRPSAPAPPGASGFARGLTDDEAAIGMRQYVLAAAVGVLVAAVLAGAAWLAWHALQPQAPTTLQASPPPVSSSRPAPPLPPAQTSAPELVTFRVVPPTATISIDGKQVAAPGRSIPRFTQGRSGVLQVHADGYDDELMVVDESVHGTIDVVLTRSDRKR